jgi:hypothetical protein
VCSWSSVTVAWTFRVQVVTDEVMRLAPVLARASETILTLRKRKLGVIDPSTLPDAELTITGDLLPAKLLGHGEVEQRWAP